MRPISPRKLRWLTTEIEFWVGKGILSAEQSGHIRDLYPPDTHIDQQKTRRLYLALFGLAILMFSMGVLFLIGYNWGEMPRGLKVALIFAAVVAFFAGSAGAYSRGRSTPGELLAFAGTLMYGNAIWLLAQIYHIESHYPDGVYWWMIGALITAHALRSLFIGVETVILLGIWVTMESSWFSTPSWSMLLWVALLLLLGWRVDSGMLLGLTTFVTALWVGILAGAIWRTEELIWPLVLLTGCAAYAWGLSGGASERASRILRFYSLLIVLGALIPMTFTEVHDGWFPDQISMMGPLTAASSLVLLVACASIFGRRPGLREIYPFFLAAACSMVPVLVLFISGSQSHENYGFVLAFLYSALSVLFGLWLIFRGVREDHAWSFFTGVIYILVFVLVRWIDLIGDLLWSSAIFFVAALVLFGTAHYWRKRRAQVTGEANAG